MSARIGVASKTPTLPQEPNVFVHRESRELLSPFWSFDNEKNGFLVNFIKATLILITFQWTSWGNQTKDIKAQSIQEVTNFGILSALSLALNISIVVTVDGNDDWPTNSTWRQAMGVIFNLASSAHVISLLASAFLLLIINETPEGRAVVLVIDHLGVWMRLPGFAFMVGVYGFCALICCWQMHTFDLTISIAVCAFCVIVASVSLFGAVVTGLQGLYKVVSAYALLTIADDAAIKTLRELFLSAKQTCLHADGIVVGYRRDEFYDWILEQYHCSNNECRVLALELSHNNVAGFLPASLGNLTALQYIYLNNNLLTGTIPSSVLSFPQLIYLYLENNFLEGSIDAAVGSMATLVVFSVAANLLTGSIPPSFSQLSQLKYIYVFENSFTGQLAPWLATPMQTQLQFVYVSTNHFTGPVPANLSSCAGLQQLELNANMLTGTVPSALGTLSQLQYLALMTNHLTQTLPSTLGQLSALNGFFVSDNHFTGTFPEFLVNVSTVQRFDVSYNSLHGTVPAGIGRWLGLVTFYVEYNDFSGSIPASLPPLRQLELFIWGSNHITGTLPAAIGSFAALQYLDVSYNRLTGTLPPALGNCSRLTSLDAEGNMLTGTIPASFGQWPQLLYLILQSNRLTGSLPPSLGGLRSLVELYLYDNALTGPWPASYGNLSQLGFLYSTGNRFTGSLPASFGNLTALQSLALRDNQLTGRLPETLAQLAQLTSLSLGVNLLEGPLSPSALAPSLQYVDLSACRFTGAVPPAVLQRPLLYLDLSQNAFSGSLPPDLWNTSVAQLLLNDNRLSGAFPPRGDRRCAMRSVSVSANRLTGRLPSDLASCVNLTAWFASDMALTGPVAGLFATQPQLQTVVVASNALTGPVDDVFAASNASGLILNAAYNALTGTLPVASLSRGRYASLILTDNCLTGTLPAAALCANGALSELLLSGLHAAPACRSDALSFAAALGLHASYEESAAVGGSLPACLLTTLRALSYLALSGNALTGRLPPAAALPSVATTLVGVDLSHNALTGPIPAALLEANLSRLDLSFNRLAGTLAASATTFYATQNTSQVSLQVNCLSGTLPAAWTAARQINVLEGNLFACAAGAWTRTAHCPTHDPLAATYACGSSTTNVALLVAATLAVAAAATAAGVWRWSQRPQAATSLAAEAALWRRGAAQAAQALRRWCDASAAAKEATALAAWLSLCCAVYAAATAATTAYAATYVWAVALALQEGVAAGAALWLWLAAASLVGLRRLTTAAGDDDVDVDVDDAKATTATDAAAAAEAATATWWRTTCRRGVVAAAIVAVNALPVFAVNLVYVYTTTLRWSQVSQDAAVAGLALFKLTWNAALSRATIGSDAARRWLPTPADRRWLVRGLVLVSLVNVIVSPLATEMLVSPNCLQYVFRAIPIDTYAVGGGTCYWIQYEAFDAATGTTQQRSAIPCVTHAALEATYNSGSALAGGNYAMLVLATTSDGEASAIDFQAGFTYNFACAFSLLQAFAYVFVYKYVCSVFGLPAVWWLLTQVQRAAGRRGATTLAAVATRCLPPLLTIDVDEAPAADGGGDGDMARLVRNATRLRQLQRASQATVSAQLVALRVVCDVAVALSFGVLFPPLGLLALGGVAADVATTRWMVQRLQRHLAAQQRRCDADVDGDGDGQAPDALQRREYATALAAFVASLEAAVAQALRGVRRDVPTVLSFAALLWALALYDVVGREAGAVGAVWALVGPATMPTWAAQLWRLVDWLRPGGSDAATAAGAATAAMEMTQVGDSADGGGGGGGGDVQNPLRASAAV